MGSIPTGLFSSLPEVEKDEVFALIGQFRVDTHPDRVNLGAGVYFSDEGKSWPLEVVGKTEKRMHDDQDITRHDYIPIEGDDRFLNVARELVFSPTFPTQLGEQQSGDRIVSVQTVSGTGANHVGARFLAEHLQPRCVWVSDPTWANHHVIWESVGVTPRTYPYYNKSDCTLNFSAMVDTLERESRPGDVILLHACAHNPTGLDPTREQWIAIADLCSRKQLFPFLDNAYQGFASGDPVQDSWAIRYFHQYQPPMEMCVAQSFSKSFGLYGQRAGAFHLVLNDTSKTTKDNVLGNLAQLIRSEYSVAPRYGSTIVRTILESESLSNEWSAELQLMSSRIRSMRLALYEELCRLRTPGSWTHITEQIGMFSYTGLTAAEVEALRKQYHVYLLASGRASVAGLNSKNVKYVAAAINAVRTKSHAI
ncbi:pyridoxal phosphate-dependent transferase [Dactylonectria estremocensis]|uniref:Aspartate aminotransferase n=1 Tax=Dactylonectria estremocensis TaxID=1079267 RepID=A0A9P9DGD3_9HYPO|nr:pyridoxal phosphate-dependent transferase [Dactylonectria estremocensis]